MDNNMSIFDKISKICNEEKKRSIRAHEQSKNSGRRSQVEDTYNHFMKTLVKTSGIKKEDIISMKVNSVERKKRY